MSQECSVNCKDNPDAVEKINWICVECKRNLKDDFERVMKQREEEAKAKAAKVKSETPGLSEEEIQKRRELQNA